MSRWLVKDCRPLSSELRYLGANSVWCHRSSAIEAFTDKVAAVACLDRTRMMFGSAAEMDAIKLIRLVPPKAKVAPPDLRSCFCSRWLWTEDGSLMLAAVAMADALRGMWDVWRDSRGRLCSDIPCGLCPIWREPDHAPAPLFTEAQVREAMVRVAGAFIAAESPAHSLGLYEDVASGRFR